MLRPPDTRPWPRRSISLRALLTLQLSVVIGLLTLAFTAAFAVWEYVDVEDRADVQLAAEARAAATLIQAVLTQQLNALSMVAADERLVAALAERRVADLSDRLASAAQANPDINRLAILDRHGVIVANSAADKTAIGRNLSDLGYVRTALAAGRPSVGMPRRAISAETTTPVLPLGVPVRDATGAVVGVLQGTTELTDISARVLPMRVGRTGQVTVALGDGTVVIHPEPNRVLTPIDTDGRTIVPPGQPLANAWILLTAPGPVSFAGSAVSDVTGWQVRTELPVAEAFEPVWRQILTSLLLAGLLALVTWGLAVRLARLLADPLERLAGAVEAQAAGAEPILVTTSAVREVEHLASTFAATRRRLAERTAQQAVADGLVRRQAARLRLLAESNQRIAATLLPASVFDEMARAAAALFDVPGVSIWVADEATQTLQLQSISDPMLALPPATPQVRVGESIAGWVAARRERLVIDDVFADGRVVLPDWWRQHALTSVCAVPVTDGDRVVAVVALLGRSPIILGAEDEDVLAMFVAQAATALRNARLYHAEAAARAQAETAEEGFRALIDAAPDGVIVVDEQGTVVLANRRVAELAQRDPAAIVGRPAAALVAEQSHLALHAFVAEVMGSPDRVHASTGHELLAARDDGRDIPIELSTMVARSPSGVRRISVVRDISERRSQDREKDALLAREQRARRDAEIAEAQVRTLIEAAADAIISVDAEGRICLVNARLEALFGYTRDELLGQRVEILMPDRFAAAHVGHRRRYVLDAGTRPMGSNLDLAARRKDGTEFPVEVSLGPVETAEGLRYFGVIVDISKRLEVERLKDQFVSVVSHELRTPLTPVIGLADLLLNTELAPQQRRMVDTIHRSGKNLLSIVNDLLDMSKLQAGKLSIEQRPVRLADLVEDAVESVAVKATAKGIVVDWRQDAGVPTVVLSDPTRVGQVLGNLLDNAVKFTHAGEVIVDLRLESRSDAGATVRFDVTDTGVGIPPDALDAIFEPFAQASDATTREYGGTGLGLAVCKQLAALLGGRIGVESTVGRGSRFWFTVSASMPAGDHTIVPEGGRADPTVAGTVLVVDPRASTRSILGERLATCGLRVTACESADAGLDALRRAAEAGEPFGLAVIASEPSDLVGIALARAIASDPVLAQTPRLLLASGPDDGVAELAEQAGVGAVLARPHRRADLREAVLRLGRFGDRPDRSAPKPAGPAPRPQPVAPAGPAARPAGSPAVRPDAAGPAPRPALPILVVDDSPMNRLVIESLLEQIGYRSVGAASGYEALDAVRQQTFAAIIMDCQMPKLDGYETTRELRRREGDGRRVPIIAMTAGAMVDDRARCLAAGMDDYLAKPVQREAFEAALARWCGAGPHAADDAATDAGSSDQDPTPLNVALLETLATLSAPDGSPILGLVVEEFAVSAPARLAELRAAIAAGDADQARRAGHRLAGECGTAGALDAEALARRLEEQIVRDGLPAGAGAAVDALEEALERGLAALRRHVRHRHPTGVTPGT